MQCWERRQSTLTPTSGRWHTSGSVSYDSYWHIFMMHGSLNIKKMFHVSLASQEYGWKLSSTWQCKVAHKLEDLGIHYKIWWELLPYPPYSTDLAPSDFHQFRALKDAIYDTKFETWWCDSPSKNLATWPGQGTVLTRHTHTFSSLAQGHRSGWRHCGKKRTWGQTVILHNLLIFMIWE
jgi:hypothetical protein